MFGLISVRKGKSFNKNSFKYQSEEKNEDVIFLADARVFKVIMAGDGSVGKTSLVKRYVSKTFTQDYLSTLGVQVSSKDFEFDDGKLIKLLIWDVAGQYVFASVRSMYYRDATVALIVYDVTNRDTFDNVSKWVREARDVEPSINIILVANKIDLTLEREVSTKEGEALVARLNLNGYVETSARTGQGVNDLFNKVVELCLKLY